MEDNKLIAKFMKFPTQTDEVDNRTMAYYVGESIMNADNTNNENDDDVFHPDDMQFNSSWDWLMPVVQKIEQDCEGVPQEMLNISLYSDINDVYNAVVEFIKNQNN